MAEETDIKLVDSMKLVKLTLLKKYSGNAKHHPEEQINKIAKSISKYGFKIPLLITEDNEIIAGHGRYAAAESIGLESVPCIVADDLSPEQVKAFRIVDNKVAESSFDLDLLKFELESLADLDYDMSSLGFNDYELEALLSKLTLDATAEWEGMPEFEAADLTPDRQLIVSFKSPKDVEAFSKLISQTITDKTKSLWFPKQEIDEVKDLRY